MIKQILKTKMGSAIAVTAVVVAVGGIATVSAAQPGANNNANAALAGYGKDQCKNGGWRDFTAPDGTPLFKNQGQCVAFFASGGNSGGNGNANTSHNENHSTQTSTVNQNSRSGNADNGAASGNVSNSSTTNMSSSIESSTSN